MLIRGRIKHKYKLKHYANTVKLPHAAVPEDNRKHLSSHFFQRLPLFYSREKFIYDICHANEENSSKNNKTMAITAVKSRCAFFRWACVDFSYEFQITDNGGQK